MRKNIAEGISDSFEDAMNSYYESASVKKDAHKFNIKYFHLRRRLMPEEQAMLDEIFTDAERSEHDATRKAFSRGIEIGISMERSIQPETEPEC
ncbi:hypothetical protein [Parablautia muri]|uniref:Uncharacterized protein n=1 Tax=Parablautia muri TaxID=2320879 RepID=A0A9X5BJP5_9FIRM|nr:hypothetical protein [Parablautia muri]NBJ95013.1 hypothetical protein [Parablautia muri]